MGAASSAMRQGRAGSGWKNEAKAGGAAQGARMKAADTLARTAWRQQHDVLP
jgi:hypothetical protein